VLDAALLGAWNVAADLDGVVEVVAPAETRVARLAALKGLTEAEARERVFGQRLPPVRGARRRWRIENAGTRAELLKAADEIWEAIEKLRSEARSG
jgi:dephospho-CoA kinase